LRFEVALRVGLVRSRVQVLNTVMVIVRVTVRIGWERVRVEGEGLGMRLRPNKG
jgi:hypothetical protein